MPNTCNHCKKDIAFRNPSGFCDHLYYPENCHECAVFLKAENPSVTVLDIETTGLDSINDRLTVVGLLKADGKSFSIWQGCSKDEARLIQDTFHQLETAGTDWVVTYYGNGFDFPFLFDRAKANKIPVPAGIREWVNSKVRNVDLNAKVYTTPQLKKFLVPQEKADPDSARMTKNRLARLLHLYVPGNMDGGACAIAGTCWLDPALAGEDFGNDMIEVCQHNALDLVTTWQILKGFWRRKWL